VPLRRSAARRHRMAYHVGDPPRIVAVRGVARAVAMTTAAA